MPVARRPQSPFGSTLAHSRAKPSADGRGGVWLKRGPVQRCTAEAEGHGQGGYQACDYGLREPGLVHVQVRPVSYISGLVLSAMKC